MIKAVLFDFDGVLTLDKSGSQSILKYISKATGISYDILKREYVKYNDDLLMGNTTHGDIWQRFCSGVGSNIEYELLTEAYRHTPIDYEMVDLVRELKAKYKTAMVTDNKCDRMDEIVTYYNLKELFQVISVSAEIKSGKASERIFVRTLEKLNVKPEECIFIDNSENNLIVPSEMGIHTILFDDGKRNLKETRENIYSIIEENH